MLHSSRKQRVKPRKIWPHEAWDFTPWLAENLALLASALNTELEADWIPTGWPGGYQIR